MVEPLLAVRVVPLLAQHLGLEGLELLPRLLLGLFRLPLRLARHLLLRVLRVVVMLHPPHVLHPPVDRTQHHLLRYTRRRDFKLGPQPQIPPPLCDVASVSTVRQPRPTKAL